jgi:KUP system potassium uptake protein
VIGDFRFVIFEHFLSYENELPIGERLTMDTYFHIKNYTDSADKWFGLDTSAVKMEKVPLIIRSAENVKLKRINPPKNVSSNGSVSKQKTEAKPGQADNLLRVT